MAQVSPQKTPYVTVTVQQPGQGGDPFRTMTNEWHAELCDCCSDTKQCCYAYWCWCCFMGSLAESIDESKWSCLCVPNALAMYRTKVRSVLHIKGGTCSDYCVTSCLPLCAGLQLRNELKYHGIS